MKRISTLALIAFCACSSRVPSAGGEAGDAAEDGADGTDGDPRHWAVGSYFQGGSEAIPRVELFEDGSASLSLSYCDPGYDVSQEGEWESVDDTTVSVRAVGELIVWTGTEEVFVTLEADGCSVAAHTLINGDPFDQVGFQRGVGCLEGPYYEGCVAQLCEDESNDCP